MKIVKPFALACLLLYCGFCAAEVPSTGTQQEISHLFARLGISGCQFSRNGSWYSPQQAVDHLNEKYQYLLGKNRIASAEDFIAEAASKSSMSGQPYLVKCGNDAPVESAGWFRSELEKLRKSAPKVSGKP
jgi:hypothetical protein